MSYGDIISFLETNKKQTIKQTTIFEVEKIIGGRRLQLSRYSEK